MKHYLLSINRRLDRRASQIVWMLILLFGTGLIAAPANAETLDGRYVPEWSSNRMVLPDVIVGTDSYTMELTLSAASPVVVSVADFRRVNASAAQRNVLDGSASLSRDNVLSIPVFKSNGRYFAADLELVALSPSPLKFQVRNLWPVAPARLRVPLSGLDYLSGTKAGVTDSQGRYFPVAGEAVTFSIGALNLGRHVAASSGAVVEYAALFASGEADQRYRRSLQVLALLDNDAVGANGINITPALKQSAAATLGRVNLDSSQFENEYAALTATVMTANPAAVPLAMAPAEINFQKLEIQSYLVSRLLEKSIPGVALSIELPNGELWHTSAGVANTASGEPMTALHKFRVGSITKSFTAMLIMQLVDEGKLRLDQKLEEFFPGLFPDGSTITIKMLLNHTAGLFSFTDEYPGFDQDYGVKMDSPPKMSDLWFVRYIGIPGYVYAPGALVNIGAGVHNSFERNNATETRPWLITKPGAAWHYSNTHYLALQEIAEQVTHRSWEDEIRRRFVVPLGLSGTVVPSAGDLRMQGIYAHGYINWADNQGQFIADLFGLPNADVDRSNTDPSFTMGSGALISTTPDLVKWANAVMEGRLLSARTQALMREPFIVNSAFGAQINMLQGVVQDLELQAFGHRGQIAGYDASWQYHYRNASDVIGTGTAMAVVVNRTLLMEFNSNGSPHVSNVNEAILEGVLDILYGGK